MNDRLADRIGAALGAFAALHEPQTPDAETVLGSISDGIVALDNDWRLIYANPAVGRLLGRDIGPMIGKPLHESLDIPPENPFRAAYMASKQSGEPLAFCGYSEIFAAWLE